MHSWKRHGLMPCSRLLYERGAGRRHRVPSFFHPPPHHARLFPGGHAAGVLDCDRDDRARAVGRLAYVHVSRPEQVARQSVSLPSPLSPLPSVVGRITGMVDCKWEKEGSGARGRGDQKSEI